MQIYTNEKLYKRNTRLAFITNLLGVLFLVASMLVLFNFPNLGLYFLLLTVGMAFYLMGTYFGRWNRRPDYAFNEALKSLDDHYSLYHYSSPASHLLMGPSGLWILLPRDTRGKISFDARRKRYKAKGAGFLARFGQESIGRPVEDASVEAEALDRYLQKHWTGGALRVQAALVFVDKETEVDGSGAPLPTTSIKKVKQILLKADPQGKLSNSQLKELKEIFERSQKSI